MKSKRTLVAIALALFAANTALSQNRNTPKESITTQTAVTRDGRIVILRSDGTWEYSKEELTVLKEDAARSTILEVQSDQLSFIEKPVLINAKLQLGSLYGSGYGDAEATHYAFMLTDEKYTTAYVYMKRGEKASELRKRLLANGGELKGSFTIQILKERYRKGFSTLMAELVDYKISSDQ